MKVTSFVNSYHNHLNDSGFVGIFEGSDNNYYAIKIMIEEHYNVISHTGYALYRIYQYFDKGTVYSERYGFLNNNIKKVQDTTKPNDIVGELASRGIKLTETDKFGDIIQPREVKWFLNNYLRDRLQREYSRPHKVITLKHLDGEVYRGTYSEGIDDQKSYDEMQYREQATSHYDYGDQFYVSSSEDRSDDGYCYGYFPCYGDDF